MGRNIGSLLLIVCLLFTFPLMAQETPVAPEGTQVATEEAPAAATNAEELRKEAQNPVASLISVPLQNNFNGGIDPGHRTQDVLTKSERPTTPMFHRNRCAQRVAYVVNRKFSRSRSQEIQS